jgi:hypothetical protein
MIVARFKIISRVAVALAGLSLTCQSALGGLSWENKSLEFRPGVADAQVVAHFKFTNTGTSPVTIKKATSSCWCVTATTSKETFSAGETGEVIATFNIGSRVGQHQKTVIVETNDESEPKVELNLKVTLLKVCKIQPVAIVWKKDEALDEKKLQVESIDGFEIKSLETKPVDPNIEIVTTTVRVIQDGRQYEILVKPKGSARPLKTMFKIEVNRAEHNHKTYFENVSAE